MVSAPASRRALLRGLTVLPLVGGATVYALPSKAEPAPDSELIRLGIELDAATATYLDVCREKAEAVARFRLLEPEIPETIVRPAARQWPPLFGGDFPPNHDGIPRCRGTEPRPLRIAWPEETEHLVRQFDGRTRSGRFYRRLHRQAVEYHEAHAAARRAVSLPEIEERRYFAGRDLSTLGFAITKIDAATLEGFAVKGRAGLAMHRAWADDRVGHIEGSYHRLLLNLASIGGATPLAVKAGDGTPCA